MAIGLAQKGVNVEIYEKRESIVPSIGRMTSLYISYRALSAFFSLGIDITSIKGSVGLTFLSFNSFDKNLTFPFPSSTGEIIMYSIDRQMLYEHLLSVA